MRQSADAIGRPSVASGLLVLANISRPASSPISSSTPTNLSRAQSSACRQRGHKWPQHESDVVTLDVRRDHLLGGDANHRRASLLALLLERRTLAQRRALGARLNRALALRVVGDHRLLIRGGATAVEQERDAQNGNCCKSEAQPEACGDGDATLSLRNAPNVDAGFLFAS